jgi:transcriptional regulator with XRE-family HTH domain
MNRDRLSMARRQGDDFENSELFLEVQAALGRKIKRLREQRGMTQRQLASIADISGPHFGLIEAGVGNVSLMVQVKIAKALGVSVSDLFAGVGGGAKSVVDSAVLRISASLERVQMHLERRKDEVARINDELKDFMNEHGPAKDDREERGPTDGERTAEPLRKMRKSSPEEG